MNDTARCQNQNPHGEAEAAQHAAQTLGDFLEDEGHCTEYQSSDDCGNHVCSLDSIAVLRIHHIDDQDCDRETGEVAGAEEDVQPRLLDAYQT